MFERKKAPCRLKEASASPLFQLNNEFGKNLMRNELYFLKNAINPLVRDNLQDDEIAAIDSYLYRVFLGPGDGEVDIEWQEDGVGYYMHSHAIDELEGPEREDYMSALLSDAKAWLLIDPDNYCVGLVVSQVFGDVDLK